TAGKAAVYAEPNREDDFARHIAHLMDHPEKRAELGRFGRERIRQELAWSHQAAQLLAGYDAILK
ncbi:MAG: glycosyltransferase, partial [Planctomycetota bacterium]